MAGIPVEINPSIDTAQVEADLRFVLANWDAATKEMKDKVNKALGGTDVQIKQTIIYETDTSGLKQAVVANKEIYDQLDKQKKEYDKQNKLQKDSVTSLRQQVNQAKQARDEISKYEVKSRAAADATGKIVVATKQLNDNWVQANLKVQALQKLLNDAGSSSFFDRVRGVFENTGLGKFSSDIQGIVGTFQSLGIIVQQLNAAFNGLVAPLKQIEALQLTFQSIGQGAAGGTQAFQEAARISQDLGVSLNSTLKGFQQLTPVITASGGTMQDVSAITESLSSRFVAFGKSADESKRIMNAVIQAFGKGKLTSEELNQQIAEADPAFRTDLAEAINVSVQALGDMIESGQVTSDVLLRAIPNMNKLASITSLAGKSATEAAQAYGGEFRVTIEQIENKINAINSISLLAFADQFKGVVQAVLIARGAIADLFSAFSQSGALDGLAAIVSDIAKGFANLVVAASSVAQAFVAIVSPIGSIVAAVSGVNVGFATLGEVIGTVIAGGIVAWFASLGAGAIASAAKVAQTAAEIGASLAKVAAAQAAKIASTASETTATAANTTAIAAETTALTANTAAKAANAVAGGAQLDFLGQLTGKWDDVTYVQKEFFDSSQYVTKGLQSAGEAAKKTTGPLASLRGGIAGLASGAPILNTNLGALAKNGFAGVAAGAKAFLASLLPILGPLALLAAAAGAVTLAVNTFQATFKAADQSTKDYSASTNALNANLKEVGVGVTQQSTALKDNQAAWDGAANRVGGVQAGLDRFRRAIGLSSAELASYNQDIEKTEAGYAQMDGAVVKTQEAISQLTPFINQDAEAKQKATTLTNGLITTLENEISTLKKKEAQLLANKAADKNEEEARQNSINQTQSRIKLQEQVLAQVQRQAQASGIVTAATKTESEALKENLELLKKKAEMIELVNQPQIDALKASWDAEKLAIEETAAKNEAKFERAKRGIQDAQNAERARHEAAKAAIQGEIEAVTRRYDAEIARLEQVKASISAAYQQQIDATKEPTGAERKLEELRIQELITQAKQGATEQERLQAQAQLERMQKDKEAAALAEEKKREEAAIQAQIDAAKQAKEAELQALKEKERAEDLAHQQAMRSLQEEANRLAREEAAAKKKEKEEEKKLAEQYGPAIMALEKEIQDAKAETKRAEILYQESVKETGDKIKDNTLAQQEFTKEINEGSIKAMQNLQAEVDELGTKIKNLPPIPSLGTRFAGGPMKAGESTYINELGKEAFLSSSGKLSWINKPAWSVWKAPSSGTVIPAHIAAGMDIPSGGVNINRSTIRNVSNSVNGGSNDYRALARVLSSISNNSGVVNNSVTISSDRPVKTASDMLVELTRIKRRRYS